jgi:NhaA family Na+:H+ antiporter
MRSLVDRFFEFEAASGLILVAAGAFAIVLANTALAPSIDAWFAMKLTISVGDAGLSKPLLLWINDGLMAVFFLLVGLELKREVIEGELSQPSQVALPVAAAVGGMAAPAAIYWALNAGDAYALRGWAIPTATDIAFSLGVLAVLGRRVPLALRVFLTTLAVVDDLGAIVVIAVFYTADLSTLSLATAGLCVAALVVINKAGVRSLVPYVLIGLVLWVSVLKSGVHATLAGVALGLAIPLKGGSEPELQRPLRALEHALHPWVSYFILPLFAFANAGVSFAGMSLADLGKPVTTGIALGLFVGKQVGIFGVVAAMILAGLARMPEGGTWLRLWGLSLVAGVGFTMSLFIGTLAFDDPAYAAPLRLGVLGGSLLSALAGWAILRFAPGPKGSPT